MRCLALLSSLFALFAVSAAEEFDYCKIKCQHGIHTSCTFKTDTPGPDCKNFQGGGLNAKQKQDTLDKHNELRRVVARGDASPQPPAANMNTLVWSLELEQIARRWAYQCTFEHDECRHTKEGKPAGQNMAISGSASNHHLNAITRWFDEHKIYTPTGDRPFVSSPKTGHYTQLAWATSQYVGCDQTIFAWTSKINGNTANHNEYLVCVYFPAGNYKNRAVYKTLPAGQRGNLLPPAGPRPGESGVPEETVLQSSPTQPNPPSIKPAPRTPKPTNPPPKTPAPTNPPPRKPPPATNPPPRYPPPRQPPPKRPLPPPATAPPVPALLPPGITLPPQSPLLPPPTKRPPPRRWYPPAQRYQPKRRNRGRYMPPWKPIYPFYPKPMRYPGRPGINCEDVPEIPITPGWGSVQAGYPAKPIECQGTVAPGIPARPGVVIIAGDD